MIRLAKRNAAKNRMRRTNQRNKSPRQDHVTLKRITARIQKVVFVSARIYLRTVNRHRPISPNRPTLNRSLGPTGKARQHSAPSHRASVVVLQRKVDRDIGRAARFISHGNRSPLIGNAKRNRRRHRSSLRRHSLGIGTFSDLRHHLERLSSREGLIVPSRGSDQNVVAVLRRSQRASLRSSAHSRRRSG